MRQPDRVQVAHLRYRVVRVNAQVSRAQAIRPEYRWVTAEEAQALLGQDHWLSKVIRRAEAMRARMPRELIEYFRAEGFQP